MEPARVREFSRTWLTCSSRMRKSTRRTRLPTLNSQGAAADSSRPRHRTTFSMCSALLKLYRTI
ncbi:hypothetical protein EON65_58760 [archaeon]|nr:MAG: hypothetical protein EON65_58760 [archaeon]